MKIGNSTVEFRKMINPEWHKWKKDYYNFMFETEESFWSIVDTSFQMVEQVDYVNKNTRNVMKEWCLEHPEPRKFLKPEQVPYYRVYIFDRNDKLCKNGSTFNYTYNKVIDLVFQIRYEEPTKFVAFPRKGLNNRK